MKLSSALKRAPMTKLLLIQTDVLVLRHLVQESQSLVFEEKPSKDFYEYTLFF